MTHTKAHQKTMQTIPFKVTSSDPATRSFVFVASDGSIDRQGDVVDQTSWNLDNYKQNPVVLWGHDYSTYPIARCLSIGINDGVMTFQPSFATADEYEEADTIYKLILGGYINACSVGFIPNEVVPAKDGSSWILKDCELLEISIVSVPANANAVRLAADEGVISIREKDLLIGHYEKAIEALKGNKKVTPPPMSKIEKSGAKHSAATLEALQKAMDHAQNAVDVIKQLMDPADDGSMDGEDDPGAEGGRGSGGSEERGENPNDATNKDIEGDPSGEANPEEGGADHTKEVDPENMTPEEQEVYNQAFSAELEKLTTGKVE